MSAIQHDYPACATFRGGKCSCDESVNLCPHCGTEEWDRVEAERGREQDVPFNRCLRCDREWEAHEPLVLAASPQHQVKKGELS